MGQRMKRELINSEKTLKAVITLHKQGYFHVEMFRWTQEIVPECNYISDFYWEPIMYPSITETLEEAEEIARKILESVA
jgi:hypothetical protein